MNKLHIYNTFLGILFTTSLAGQTGEKVGNLENTDVTIVKEYQPVLNDAYKISIVPEGDTSTTTFPVLNYSVEPKQSASLYNLTPIKPVKIKDDNIKKLYRGFIKAGYGNYNTPLVELKYNSIRSKLFDAGVEAKHLSSTGKIKGYGQPDYNLNTIGLHGTRFFDNNAVSGKLKFDRDVYHFYGYDSPPELFTKSETRHLLNVLRGDFNFYSTHRNKDKLSYHAGIGFQGFSDNLSSNESLIKFSTGGGKRFDDNYISADINLEMMNIDQPGQDVKRSIFAITPRYKFTKNQFDITAGVNLGYESADDADTKLHLHPHVRTSLQVLKNEVTVYAQLTGNVSNNTLTSYSTENKFLDNLIFLENTNNKIDLSAGVNAKLSREFIATANITFSRLINNPYFININNPFAPVKFRVIYDDVNIMALHTGFDFKQGEKMSLGLRLDYFTYDNDSLEKPLYKPIYRIGLNGTYSIAEKIYIRSELYLNSSTYALEYENLKPQYVKLKSYTDINLGMEYRYSKILSGFVQVNNLAMQKYFRYYNYPTYRTNFMAGITYSFW